MSDNLEQLMPSVYELRERNLLPATANPKQFTVIEEPPEIIKFLTWIPKWLLPSPLPSTVEELAITICLIVSVLVSLCIFITFLRSFLKKPTKSNADDVEPPHKRLFDDPNDAIYYDPVSVSPEQYKILLNLAREGAVRLSEERKQAKENWECRIIGEERGLEVKTLNGETVRAHLPSATSSNYELAADALVENMSDEELRFHGYEPFMDEEGKRLAIRWIDDKNTATYEPTLPSSRIYSLSQDQRTEYTYPTYSYAEWNAVRERRLSSVTASLRLSATFDTNSNNESFHGRPSQSSTLTQRTRSVCFHSQDDAFEENINYYTIDETNYN